MPTGALGRAAISAILLSACGGGEPSLLDDPLAPLPADVAGLGLYLDPGDLDAVDPRAQPYAPLQPLWSNGSDKQRYIALPEAATIDVGARDRWQFPAGTLLFKTFSFAGLPVETRVMRRDGDRWEFAAYRWREGGADLLDLAEPVAVTVTADGEPIEHLIPSRLDCRSCHESSPVAVLGFDELGLGADQLTAFAAAFDGELPADPEVIAGDSALERDVKTYLEGNCTHCHNGGDGPASSYDLRHPVALDQIVCRPTNASQTADGLRVQPGEPDASVLFLAVSGETDDPEVKSMPPVGVQLRDREGVELLRSWIESLPGGCEP